MSRWLHETTPVGAAQFASTFWTVVLAAGDTGSPTADAALERLCGIYWYPLYTFVRRRGYDAHEAQDLTQEFFARLLEKDFLRAVDRNKGKFRSFLLAALQNFLAKDWRRSRAQKRGGNLSFLSLGDASAEQLYLQVPASGLSAERVFEQQWAIALLGQTVARLQTEFRDAGKEALFQQLKIFLTGEKREASCAELAARLGMTEGALKMAVSRMRQRYGELLRAEIANTVSSPDEIQEELHALFAALSL